MGDDGGKCLKKTNLLVYQQPVGQKVNRKPIDNQCKTVKLPICKPKSIKVCTGADLRKMCPPKECPCEPPKPRTLLRLLGFGCKSAIAAAAIYVTYDLGIWGTVDDTQRLYGAACTIFGQPQPKRNTKWDPPSCEAESDLFPKGDFKPYSHCDEPPIQMMDLTMKSRTWWNKCITSMFHCIVNFSPKKFIEGTSQKKGDSIEWSPKCVSYQDLSEAEKENLSYYK